MHDKVLNITNGDYFNEYLKSKLGEESVPFCEAMMDGETTSDIFSDEFVATRSRALNVTEDEYRSKMHVPRALSGREHGGLCLWFGKDTFCQVNLLTLLTYLEQIGYPGEVRLNYIDDESFEVLESGIEVELGGYGKIYEDIFASKCVPRDVGVLCERAIELYFDYKSEDGALARLVNANADKSRVELVHLLLKESKEYGLSDAQAEGLIDSALPR